MDLLLGKARPVACPGRLVVVSPSTMVKGEQDQGDDPAGPGGVPQIGGVSRRLGLWPTTPGGSPLRCGAAASLSVVRRGAAGLRRCHRRRSLSRCAAEGDDRTGRRGRWWRGGLFVVAVVVVGGDVDPEDGPESTRLGVVVDGDVVVGRGARRRGGRDLDRSAVGGLAGPRGCSLATTTPIAMVAPVATRAADWSGAAGGRWRVAGSGELVGRGAHTASPRISIGPWKQRWCSQPEISCG